MKHISEFGRHTLRVAAFSLVGLIAGVTAALATVSLDRALGFAAPVPVENVRQVMGALIGGVLTIAVFTLWMRTVVVSLTSGEISPRIVSGYLDDGFQRAVTGWMVGGLSYLVAVALALPTGSDDGIVPLISSVLSGLIVIVALVSVLLAMRHAVSSLSPPNVIRSLTDRALAQLSHPDLPNDPVSVVCTAAWDPAVHLAAVFEQLNRTGWSDAFAAQTLLKIFGSLEDAATEVGDERSIEVLRNERSRWERTQEE